MRDAFLGSSSFVLPNGRNVDSSIIQRAHECDGVSMDILWRGSVSFFEGTVYLPISRICFERDMRQRSWFTRRTTILKRYASSLVRDWVIYGDGSERMFYDMAGDYVRQITETALSLGEKPPFDNTLIKYCDHILPKDAIKENMMIIHE